MSSWKEYQRREAAVGDQSADTEWAAVGQLLDSFGSEEFIEPVAAYVSSYEGIVESEWAAVEAKAQRYLLLIGAAVAWFSAQLTANIVITPPVWLLALCFLLWFISATCAMGAIRSKAITIQDPAMALEKAESLTDFRWRSIHQRLWVARLKWRANQPRTQRVRLAETFFWAGVVALAATLTVFIISKV